MEFDCIELERRLAIGFNEHLSLAQRDRYVRTGVDLDSLAREDPRFKFFRRETKDVIKWLCSSADNHVIWYGDPEFPCFNPLKARLPYMLFCLGQVPQPRRVCVAIVGTRHATYSGIQQAFRFGMEATENSLEVISGFAEGIDQSGMNGAIEGGGPCIGVLACGHDVEYPGLTMSLRKRMLNSGGCILSRFAPSQVPYKSSFISRNMVIAAYSSFVVAVQAPGKSGVLSTCDYALSLGKEIYVGSQGVGDRFVQAGTSQLFKDGAPVISEMSECEVEGIQFKFHVLEYDEDLMEKSNYVTSKRFGDRMYVVKNMIG